MDAEKAPAMDIPSASPTVSEGTTAPPAPAPSIPPFSTGIFDKTPAASAAFKIYLKVMVGGIFALSLVIFGAFLIYWGSLWTTPKYPVKGWIVDFDSGFVGQSVLSAINAIPSGRGIAWEPMPPSQFPGGVADLEEAVRKEKMFYGLAINVGAMANYTAALSNPTPTYDGSNALWFIGAEARNENLYPIHIQIILPELKPRGGPPGYP
ncbi:unnamed protein product [Mycena citricolor]|uniref:DUF3533 domain-containing protein n=1 Tax=Mycena citricolor TaxID=2018698 RepID=A0AAD2K7Z3_9AGAR|nr:unnamed protein product [Mycena citricolor]